MCPGDPATKKPVHGNGEDIRSQNAPLSNHWLIIIIFYFENVAFFHAKLGSDVSPRVDNQTFGETLQDFTRPLVENSPSASYPPTGIGARYWWWDALPHSVHPHTGQSWLSVINAESQTHIQDVTGTQCTTSKGWWLWLVLFHDRAS